jgi:tetratricopeptide (TPR) repeat protein
MQLLMPPATHFLSAAQGWLELGNISEALAELDQIEDALQNHPHVLEMRWAVLAQAGDWPAALEIARLLSQISPDSQAAWLHHAYALRRVPDGGLEPARKALLQAAKKFPLASTVAYNLACYACQLGDLAEARNHFQQALKTGDPRHIRKIALEDSDLQPLWAEIRNS